MVLGTGFLSDILLLTTARAAVLTGLAGSCRAGSRSCMWSISRSLRRRHALFGDLKYLTDAKGRWRMSGSDVATSADSCREVAIGVFWVGADGSSYGPQGRGSALV